MLTQVSKHGKIRHTDTPDCLSGPIDDVEAEKMTRIRVRRPTPGKADSTARCSGSRRSNGKFVTEETETPSATDELPGILMRKQSCDLCLRAEPCTICEAYGTSTERWRQEAAIKYKCRICGKVFYVPIPSPTYAEVTIMHEKIKKYSGKIFSERRELLIEAFVLFALHHAERNANRVKFMKLMNWMETKERMQRKIKLTTVVDLWRNAIQRQIIAAELTRSHYQKFFGSNAECIRKKTRWMQISLKLKPYCCTPNPEDGLQVDVEEAHADIDPDASRHCEDCLIRKTPKWDNCC
jgi:hypothetical protein